MRLLVTLLSVAVLVGCSGDKKDPDSELLQSEHLARAAAGELIANFATDLKGELVTAMNDSGPLGALDVCKVKAPEIALAHTQEAVWSIKRVSERFRNPDNQASEAEQKILTMFADTSGEAVPRWSEWTTSSGGDSTFTLFQAIRVSDLCLKCHGGASQLAPGVADKLAELYPNDRATGYASGDLRGMFVVTVAWPEARAAAEKLTAPPAKATAY